MESASKQMLKLTQRQWSCPKIHLYPMEERNLEDGPRSPPHTLITHLTTNPSDAHTLFYKGKKTTSSSTEEHSSSRDKGDIYHILLKLIFKKDSEYSVLYAENQKIRHISGQPLHCLFRDHHDKFNKTGAGITLLDEHMAANLHIRLMFTSQLGVNHATDYYSLVRPRGGLVLLQNHLVLSSLSSILKTLSPLPQTPSCFSQTLSSLFGAYLILALSVLLQALGPVPRALRMPLHILCTPLPSQHLPFHFSGTEGSPINDPDGDLNDNPHADDNSPFFAPFGNTLGILGGGDVDMDDDNGMELDPSCHRVISLDSPPKLEGWKQQYAESRNERYAIKMNYQAQKKDLQWYCENLSHKVLILATTHQCEQEAKDKEILRLQAAAALQEREAETWRLKI
ncbi:hypothetical protein F4604DRAFT_1936335 [Suillus subluteus]|nr:hypothetical protein F4604DRAFT_1936335 [Suillus subluteus]